MEDVEITFDEPEAHEEPSAEAPRLEAEQPEAEARPERREERSEQPEYDPTSYYRQRVAARQQRAEQQRLSEIQRRMDELARGGGAKPEDKPAPAAPDRQQDPEGWALHQMQEAARKALREELAPILASREQNQQQQFTQQAEWARQQEQMAEIAHLAEQQERHYPGYRERLAAWSEGRISLAVSQGKPVQAAQQEVAAYIDMLRSYAERVGENPVHALDVHMTRELDSWQWKPASLRAKDEAARAEVAETKKALASPTARSMGAVPRAAQSGGKITGASLVKFARANGGKVERGDLVRAAKSRMAEVNGNFSEAMSLILQEVQQAEARKSA